MSAAILIIEYLPSNAQKATPPEQWASRAEQIGNIDGLLWKYWLRSKDNDRLGGVYLFSTLNLANDGGDKLNASLVEAGATDIERRVFEVDSHLSSITRGMVSEHRSA